MKQIDFVGLRRFAFIISFILILACLGSLIIKGGPNFGIDFVGGILVQIKFSPSLSSENARSILYHAGFENPQIQSFPADQEMIIRLKKGPDYGEDMEEKIYAAFREAPGIDAFTIQRVEMVGPAVGKKLLSQAIFALFWGLIVIMLYIGLRFEFTYAAPAAIALLHDLIITLGIFSMLDKEITITVIAALLTLAGYSINDTIVIYDRIREKRRAVQRKSLKEVMNLAINATLSRTAITSLTISLVLLSLFFFGGEVIHDFSLALLIGVVVGTYSSIFVASPLVYAWERHHHQ